MRKPPRAIPVLNVAAGAPLGHEGECVDEVLLVESVKRWYAEVVKGVKVPA